ncbi:MAG: hypothetical protein ABDH66_05285 [Bacteroidia bacterium]
MAYSPEEYEKLKEFYKQDLRERKAFMEALRHRLLRQKVEWELRQMETSLRRLGMEQEPESVSSSPSTKESPSPFNTKTLL